MLPMTNEAAFGMHVYQGYDVLPFTPAASFAVILETSR